jgi:hypothetical protein
MCRSIKTLRTQETVSDEEIRAAALQFVRKISGFRQPSKANTEPFDAAVDEIAVTTERLLDLLRSSGQSSWRSPVAAAPRPSTPRPRREASVPA